jgi:small-conductance mechanosensitive channel
VQHAAVGDWIEIAGIRGEVIDQNILSVTLQEIYSEGPLYEYTGRTIVIPNSQFLTTPAKNENFIKRYVYHTFSLVVPPQIDIQEIEYVIAESLARDMESYIDVAKRYNALIERKAGIDIMGTDPLFRVTLTGEGKVRLSVTIFVPTKRAIDIEQNAIRLALPLLHRHYREGSTAQADSPPKVRSVATA